ncbi:CBS domain-containing protein [Marinomonas epiphytica]
MKTLTYVSTKNTNELTFPVLVENTDLYSSALSVFTDFKTVAPRLIESNTRAEELVRLMRKEHVRMKVVVDANNRFEGIISLKDLSDEAFVKKVAQGVARADILVADLMRNKEDLLALSYTSLRKSDIESLLFSQKNNQFQHLLIIDEDSKQICGLISSNDIARRLKIDINVGSSSFAAVYKKVNEGYITRDRQKVA